MEVVKRMTIIKCAMLACKNNKKGICTATEIKITKLHTFYPGTIHAICEEWKK